MSAFMRVKYKVYELHQRYVLECTDVETKVRMYE